MKWLVFPQPHPDPRIQELHRQRQRLLRRRCVRRPSHSPRLCVEISSVKGGPVCRQDPNFIHLCPDPFSAHDVIEAARTTGELQQEVMKFLGTTDLDEGRPVFANLRRSSGAEDVVPALKAWVRRAEIVASEQKVRATYSARKISKAVPEIRALAASEEGVGKVPAFLHDLGIRFVVVESLPRTKVDGAALFNKSGGPLLALSMRYDRIDWFWFTLMHEIAHLALEYKGGHLDLEDGDTIDGECPSAGARSRVGRLWRGRCVQLTGEEESEAPGTST